MKRLLIVVFMFPCLISCKSKNALSMQDFSNDEQNVFDVSILCEKPYDFLLILDEGTYLFQFDLSKYNIQSLVEDQWLGEKIFFILDKKIIKQINVDYYISEPKKHHGYISFFYETKPSTEYIYRDYKDSIFHIKIKKNLKNDSYCYYLE